MQKATDKQQESNEKTSQVTKSLGIFAASSFVNNAKIKKQKTSKTAPSPENTKTGQK